MINIFFELDRLRDELNIRGVDARTVNLVVARARQEIEEVIKRESHIAMDAAVEVGVEKRSPEFINELHLDTLIFEIDTETGQLDFSEPPKPMLPHLLKNAKPIKDGSGVYKVIPVGKPGDRAKVSTSIFDVQKRIAAERAEAARSRTKAIMPAGSKQEFRVATSKQDPTSQWVLPATNKDFTEDVKTINDEMTAKMDTQIYDIIQSYLEMYG